MFEDMEQMAPSDLLPQMQFVVTVEAVAALLSTVLAEERLPEPPRRWYRKHFSPSRKMSNWHHRVVHDSETRLFEVLYVLRKPPQGGQKAHQVYLTAFSMLSKLTPHGNDLTDLVNVNQKLAFQELVRHLEVAGQNFVANATITPGSVRITEAADKRFASHSEQLLERAGGAYTLTEAARAAGISRQAMHKRVYSGTALGMMDGENIIVPKLQFTAAGEDGRLAVLAGIGRVVRTFQAAGASGWSTLQFLVEVDPNLARPPIEALRAGEVQKVERAARGHLRMDEE